MIQRKWLVLVLLLSIVAAGISARDNRVAAQTRSDPASLVIACTEMDFTKVTADTLGMSTADLRIALVSGKTVQEIAEAKKLPLQNVVEKYAAALNSATVTAVADGLINQQQAVAIRSQTAIFPGAQLPGLNVPADSFGGITPFSGQSFLWGGMTLYNYSAVKPLVIAARALDLKCADLVKQAQPNKTVILIAAEKRARIQDLIDALVAAYRTALDQDVKTGLMTAAQADGQKVRLLERVVTQISQPGLMVPRLVPTPLFLTPTPNYTPSPSGTHLPTPLATRVATLAR